MINSLPSELAAAAVAAATNTNSSVSNHSIRGERLFPNQTGIAPLPSLGTNKTDSSTIGGATGTTATVPLPSLASGERNELTRMPSFQQPTAALHNLLCAKPPCTFFRRADAEYGYA